uniref:Uncharacterized protein n=1 Tax=Alexandrium monilatum TaxID=311494 RepID=A0A7S4RPI0_9DINO|mmetsp:Transcript_3774/g.11542  ORF Transcript_3774/g.11542 Transcript_3774/m.11542 type:complete len:185 (+) Transcript_3774:92-646(+)
MAMSGAPRGGRTMAGAEMSHWGQRVEKEEKAFCVSPRQYVGPPHRAWHVAEALQRPRRQKSQSLPRPASLSSLPDDLQAICSWPLVDRPLMTMRAGKGAQLRFQAVVEPAAWVPSRSNITVYRPAFAMLGQEAPRRRTSRSATPSSSAPRDPWRLPPAGMKGEEITLKNAPGKMTYENSVASMN